MKPLAWWSNWLEAENEFKETNMSILIDSNTKVVCQGLGRAGQFHARQMIEYGTQVVAGVRPGKGGESFEGVPIFDEVKEAVEKTGADPSVLFVPAPYAGQAMIDAGEAGAKLVICITEGIPTFDVLKAKRHLNELGVRLVGPNCPGVITPGACKIGIMPGYIHKPGTVGIVSRSGTLTYEAVWQVGQIGRGQSTCIGIGGDPVIGTGFIDTLKLFQEDPDTESVILIGEIGGTAEQEAAQWIASNMSKPVAAFVAGRTAPKGKRMGHAGAIIAGGEGTAQEKIEIFRECGVHVSENPALIGQALARALDGAA